MKKNFLLISMLLLLFSLTSCVKNDSVVHIMMPSGSPALGMMEMIHEGDSIDGYKLSYSITDSVDIELPSSMTSGSHEIVIAPTNLGANLYNKDAHYLYAGAITFGNLYLVTNEASMTIDTLDGKTIAAFGQGAIPGILLEKIMTVHHYTIVDTFQSHQETPQIKIDYFNSVSDVTPQLLAKHYDFALLAEPVLSIAASKDSNLYVIGDLQQEYNQMNNTLSYPQAGIFVKESFAVKNPQFIDDFLERVQQSTEYANLNPETVANYYNDCPLIVTDLPVAALAQAIPNAHIGFASVTSSVTDLETFYQFILEFKPALLGGQLPDEGFYWYEES